MASSGSLAAKSSPCRGSTTISAPSIMMKLTLAALAVASATAFIRVPLQKVQTIREMAYATNNKELLSELASPKMMSAKYQDGTSSVIISDFSNAQLTSIILLNENDL